jgi:hypothetical protein
VVSFDAVVSPFEPSKIAFRPASHGAGRNAILDPWLFSGASTLQICKVVVLGLILYEKTINNNP